MGQDTFWHSTRFFRFKDLSSKSGTSKIPAMWLGHALSLEFLASWSNSSRFNVSATPYSNPFQFGKAKIARKRKNSYQTTNKFLYALGSSLLHFVQVTFGYILMLAVMTFHPGIFFAAVVGLTVGYFVFQAVLQSNSKTW